VVLMACGLNGKWSK